MASASGYNHHRFARAVLKKSRKWEPSLTVQLFTSHWRFENSPMTFQYNGPMAPFLLALRAQVIPASLIPFLYDIRPPVSFVDGCLVVEMHDFRKTPEVRSRIVMRPAAETLAQTIDVMLERKGERWDETMALELESRIIAATSPPLYLGTSILATRNAVLSLSLTSPAGPNLSADGTFRHPSTFSGGDEKSEVERMRKLLRAGERSSPFQPTWNILRMKEYEENKQRERSRTSMVNQEQPSMTMATSGTMTTGAPVASGGSGGGAATTSGGGASGDKPKKNKKKRPPEDEGKDERGKKSKKKKGEGKGDKKTSGEKTKKKSDKKKNDE